MHGCSGAAAASKVSNAVFPVKTCAVPVISSAHMPSRLQVIYELPPEP